MGVFAPPSTAISTATFGENVSEDSNTHAATVVNRVLNNDEDHIHNEAAPQQQHTTNTPPTNGNARATATRATSLPPRGQPLLALLDDFRRAQPVVHAAGSISSSRAVASARAAAREPSGGALEGVGRVDPSAPEGGRGHW